MKSNSFSKRNTLKPLLMCGLVMSALGLSGCAQMMNLGDLIWTESKHATVKTSHKVMAMLRPKAPRAEPVFVHNDVSAYEAQSQYTPPSLRGQNVQDSQPIAIEFYQRPQEGVQTASAAQTTPRPISTPRPSPVSAPFQGSETQLALAPASEMDMPDMAYVKLSGSTSISDWQSCQAEAGSYIQPRGAGFIVHPNFDDCMRARGYIPEREALVFMERVALP